AAVRVAVDEGDRGGPGAHVFNPDPGAEAVVRVFHQWQVHGFRAAGDRVVAGAVARAVSDLVDDRQHRLVAGDGRTAVESRRQRIVRGRPVVDAGRTARGEGDALAEGLLGR